MHGQKNIAGDHLYAHFFERSAFYHLHNIRRIRKYLSRESTLNRETCSCLRYQSPRLLQWTVIWTAQQCYIAKLQRVQNAAARILYRAPRFSHITPLLDELHWFPVKYRIEYKIIT